MSPLYFASIWIKFDGDLWKVWRFTNGNVPIILLIQLYKRIYKVVNGFPKIKIKTRHDLWPKEFANEIDGIIKGESIVNLHTVEAKYRFKNGF